MTDRPRCRRYGRGRAQWSGRPVRWRPARVSRSAGGRASARGGSRCRRGGRRCREGRRCRGGADAGPSAWPVLHPARAAPMPAHDQQAGREAAPASQVPALTSHRLFPSGARGKSLRDGVARTPWRRSLPRESTLPGPGTGLAARSMGGGSPGVTAPAGAVCLPGLAGRTRSLLLPHAPVGDHGRAGGVSAISITRYGDEAYDFRDIRGPGLIRLESGRRLGWPQFLGAGMLCPECHQDNPPVRKSCGLCGVSVPPSWPRPPRPAGHPSARVRQRVGQSRTRMSGAACCEYCDH